MECCIEYFLSCKYLNVLNWNIFFFQTIRVEIDTLGIINYLEKIHSEPTNLELINHETIIDIRPVRKLRIIGPHIGSRNKIYPVRKGPSYTTCSYPNPVLKYKLFKKIILLPHICMHWKDLHFENCLQNNVLKFFIFNLR